MVGSGLEVLLEGGPEAAGLKSGARIGLVAHPASIDRSGRHAADLISRGARLRLVRLFGPEHGLRGEAQDMEPVSGGTDADTGVRVVSLYGSDPASLRPRREDLDGLDAIVSDLQDVGSRYYTFVYTMAHVMEAAAEAGIPIIVLDRPNPIGGVAVEGPVLDPSLASFVGRFPIPVRHGMTPAELGRFFNEEFGIGCDLRVVPMRGYERAQRFEQTGLPWVAPSPNMPTPTTAAVYPGACLIEGTNLSEGRGTTRPFEMSGAPWLPARPLAEALSREGLPGAIFRATTFRPSFHKHAGESCSGVQVHVTDAGAFRPFETYLVLLREARRLAAGSFDWRREPYEFEGSRLAIDLLLGRSDLRSMIEAGAGLRDMEAAWARDLAAFRRVRERFLIYPE